MGSGSWTTASFVNYATTRGYDTDSRGVVTTNYSNQEMLRNYILMHLLVWYLTLMITGT